VGETLRNVAYLAFVLGLAVAIGLVAWHGFETVAAAMVALGAGVFLLPLIYAPHYLGAAASWSLNFPEGRRPTFPKVLRAIWIGIGVETLMPLGGLAAEVVKARLLIRDGTRPANAASLAVVDMTVQIVVLIFWALLGFSALIITGPNETLFWPITTGAAFLTLAIGTMLYAQYAGLFGKLAQWGAGSLRSARWQGLADNAHHLDRTIRAIYARPLRVAAACAIRCTTRGLMAVEIFVAAWLMASPITASDAVMFIGIISTLRAAAFVVPGGWGLQEGAYVVLGQMVGLEPEIALALSLATRARELMTGVPALMVWQFIEGRMLKSLLERRSAAA
jgi:glycosyltransferase 2 family protein